MAYYEDEENIRNYLRMAEGIDGRKLVEKLKTYLAPGATVLELGMGPGIDLDILQETFNATGSDRSRAFLERYRTKHPEADLLELDAVTIDTPRRFQGIYSNKVLHHLTEEELPRSLERQAQVLEPSGIALHTFWRGNAQETHHGLLFTFYVPRKLKALVPPAFEILETSLYAESVIKDSICLVLRRR